MIWLQPWMGLGALAVALPVLIHLLGRGRARTERFPSLRFITDTRLQPTRRTRIHDVLLLLVRVVIVLVAVAALAQPYFTGGARRQQYVQSMARVILLDTSASMHRNPASGRRLLDAARVVAQQLADSSTTHLLVATANVVDAVAGASAWLAQQPWRTELVIVSDFQANRSYREALAAVPTSIGVRLVRLPPDAGSETTRSPSEMRLTRDAVSLTDGSTSTLSDVKDAATIVVRTNASGTPGTLNSGAPSSESARASTEVEWSRGAPTVAGTEGVLAANEVATVVPTVAGTDVAIDVIVSSAERVRSATAVDAATAVTPLPVRSFPDTLIGGATAKRRITIVSQASTERAVLLAASDAVRTSWMVDLITGLRESDLLHDATRSAATVATSSVNGASTRDRTEEPDSTSALHVARSATGHVIISARQSGDAATPRLLLFLDLDASTETGANTLAALIAATRRVAGSSALQEELEPAFVDDTALRSLERASSSAPTATYDSQTRDPLSDPSDARWAWMVVLALLAMETMVRRRVSPGSGR